jgi:anthranilate synthase component 1
LLTDTLLIFDNVTHRITVVSNAVVRDESDPGVERTYRESQQKIDAIIAALRRPVGAPAGFPGVSGSAEPDSTFTRQGFCEAVRKAKTYIQAGDVIQVVLSQRLALKTEADPFDVYRALRVVNPSPYMYYLRLGDLRVVGSSPEMLVRMEGERIDLRPIGHAPRGDEEEDRTGSELWPTPSGRAHHAGGSGPERCRKVARVGSVPSRTMTVERTP